MHKPILQVAAFLLFARSLLAEDWPQFLGPGRDGHYTASDIADSLPKTGLPVLWKKEVGQGFSSPVVSGDRLILFHRVGNRRRSNAWMPRQAVGSGLSIIRRIIAMTSGLMKARGLRLRLTVVESSLLAPRECSIVSILRPARRSGASILIKSLAFKKAFLARPAHP